MLKLLKKEFCLAMHPSVLIMLICSAMVLIPNYPLVVIFFYVSLGLFFTCLQGRENNDIVYSLNLPVEKKQIVKARILFAVIVELVQLVLMVPITILKQNTTTSINQAGMSANITLFGLGFIVFGLANFVFFSGYYKDVNKVGIPFVKTSIIVFILCALDVTLTHAVPFVKDKLNTYDNVFVKEKLIVLAAGIIVFVLLTLLVYKKSVRNFEKQDIH